jgi:hypothetical protein
MGIAPATAATSLELVVKGEHKEVVMRSLEELTLDEAVDLALAADTLASLARHRAFMLRNGGVTG